MDKLHLNNMQFYGYHGVFAEENMLGQMYSVDLTLELDLSIAGRSDDLTHTISYPDIVHLTRTIVEGPPVRLIEALAERIAQSLLDNYTNVDAVTVRVTKPHPPVNVHFDGVTVEIHRDRQTA